MISITLPHTNIINRNVHQSTQSEEYGRCCNGMAEEEC